MLSEKKLRQPLRGELSKLCTGVTNSKAARQVLRRGAPDSCDSDDGHQPTPMPPRRMELNVNSECTTTEVCRKLDEHSAQVFSFFTVANRQDYQDANLYLAEKIAKRWEQKNVLEKEGQSRLTRQTMHH